MKQKTEILEMSEKKKKSQFSTGKKEAGKRVFGVTKGNGFWYLKLEE